MVGPKLTRPTSQSEAAEEARRRQGPGGNATRPRQWRRRTTLTRGVTCLTRLGPHQSQWGKFKHLPLPRLRKAGISFRLQLLCSDQSGLSHAPMAEAESVSAAAAAGASPGTDSSTAPKAGESLIAYFITKDYERIEGDNTIEKVKETQMKKLKGYLAICTLVLGSMHLGAGEKVLKHMRKTEKEFASSCVHLLTVAYFWALVGITAGMLPDNAPWPLFFGGLGAWLSFIFVLALFHMETSNYYLEPAHAKYSFYTCFLLFSLYWSHAAQDPLVAVEVKGKCFELFWESHLLLHKST